MISFRPNRKRFICSSVPRETRHLVCMSTYSRLLAFVTLQSRPPVQITRANRVVQPRRPQWGAGQGSADAPCKKSTVVRTPKFSISAEKVISRSSTPSSFSMIHLSERNRSGSTPSKSAKSIGSPRILHPTTMQTKHRKCIRRVGVGKVWLKEALPRVYDELRSVRIPSYSTAPFQTHARPPLPSAYCL